MSSRWCARVTRCPIEPARSAMESTGVHGCRSATAAALLGLGRLELSRGDAADASIILQNCSPLRQTTCGDDNLGVALDLQGRHEAAQAEYAKLLRIQPVIGQRPSTSTVALAQRSGRPVRGSAARSRHKTRRDAPHAQDLAVALTLSGNTREAHRYSSPIFRPAMPRQPRRVSGAGCR